MNLKRYLAYSLLGCLLGSCGDSREEYPSSGIPICFSGNVDTRGAAVTTDNISSMGVTAVCHTGDFVAQTDELPYFMNNQKMEKMEKKEVQGWTYTPVKYWPEEAEQKISFFAYSPYGTEDNGLSVSKRWLSYQTPVASENHPDLLVATPVLNRTAASGTAVSFTFRHVLARVSFTFASEDVSAEVSNVQLSGIISGGSISLAGEATLLDGEAAEWQKTEKTTTVSYAYRTSGEPEYMMLLPQSTTGVQLSYHVGETVKSVNLSEVGVSEWKKGQAYNYRIQITNEKN